MLSWLARCCGCGVRHHDQSQRAPAGAPRSVQMTDRGASYVRLQQALDQAAQQMAQATAAAAAQQQGPPPASTSALKRIPIVRVAADDLTKDNECCTICLEDHVPGELAARLPCGHLFHKDCVVEWLRRHCVSRAAWKSTSELGCWNFHAIEQMQLRRKYRVDGVGRPKFDFHTGAR